MTDKNGGGFLTLQAGPHSEMTVHRPAELSELPPPPLSRTGWPWTEASPRLPNQAPDGFGWPRITVVTPSFNQAAFLEETIRSVLLQSYPNLEYFIVDGGSTDGSVETIQRYSPWLAGYTSAPDRGQSHAINKGFAQATGVILAWLNSDDTYEPGSLAVIGRSFSIQPEAVLIYGQAYRISSKGRRIGQAHARNYDRRWLLEQANSIPQPSAFFSRAGWREVGSLDETLHFAMDYDLWFRLGACGPVLYLPEFLSNQRIYPQAKTSSGDHRHYREVRQVIERHGGSGLPAGFENWLVETHLPKAWEAYQAGDSETGRAELSYVLDNVPAWRAEDRLAQEIARYAWAMNLGLAGQATAGLAFAEQVCRNLPGQVARPEQVRRRVLAALHKASAYRHLARGERTEVWRHMGQTLVHAPSEAKDRGLWAVALRSLKRSRLDQAGPVDLGPARQRVLAWLETLRSGRAPGQYGLRAGASQPSLEASSLAAQVRAVWGAPALAPVETAAWLAFLEAQPAAAADVDALEADPNERPRAGGPGDALDFWQSTVQLINARRGLGATDPWPVSDVEPLLSAQPLADWLAERNWAQPRRASDQVRLLAVGLAHEHARTRGPAYWQALENIGDWVAGHVEDETGQWTFGEPVSGLEAIGNACNLLPIFVILKRPLPDVEPVITLILDLQQYSGLFGAGQPDEAWADLAAIDSLARLSRSSDFRAAEVRLAMAFALRSILRRQEPDGGFGASARLGASELGTTWHRSLTLAIIGARWPELLTEKIHSGFPPLPDLGSGHSASAPANPPSTQS